MRLVQLTVGDVHFLAHRLAAELMYWDEPIPPFETRFPNALESSLFVPFQTFGKKPLYVGLVPKAAILFYLLIKNHPFKNGNKRIAVMSLLVFLSKNKKWLSVSKESLYRIAKFVAESDPALRESVVRLVEDFIKKYLVAWSEKT